MGTTKSKPKRKPGLTPEARENQLINMVYDEVEKRILDGTATSQMLTHFLKLGSTKAELEREKLKNENVLLEAKTKQIDATIHTDELVGEALKAFKLYSGNGDDDSDEDIQWINHTRLL